MGRARSDWEIDYCCDLRTSIISGRRSCFAVRRCSGAGWVGQENKGNKDLEEFSDELKVTVSVFSGRWFCVCQMIFNLMHQNCLILPEQNPSGFLLELKRDYKNVVLYAECSWGQAPR